MRDSWNDRPIFPLAAAAKLYAITFPHGINNRRRAVVREFHLATTRLRPAQHSSYLKQRKTRKQFNTAINRLKRRREEGSTGAISRKRGEKRNLWVIDQMASG